MSSHPALAGLLAAGGESGKAGPMGLLVIILLGITVYFLGRSMSRHLGRVPASFDQADEPAGASLPGGPPRPSPEQSGSELPGSELPGSEQPGPQEPPA